MAAVKPKIIVQNITVKNVLRKTQDIENWKNAIKQFTHNANPSRVLMYDLYEDIMLDGQIESTWGKRQDAVLNRELVFMRDGVEDEQLYKLLNSYDMRLIMKELHNCIAWGYTLLQINSITWNEEEEQYKIAYDLIPRKHVHPERNFECVSFEQSFTSRDILFKQPPYNKYILSAGDPYDMGLLVKAAQYVIYKRGDFGDWAQYAEMFGMPFREGRYDDYDNETRIALERMMEAYGGANYAILPRGAEFKIHETSGAGGSNTLYKDLYAACNAEISKIMLGNTLTTEQGDKGARSLGDVHAEGEKIKNQSDETLLLSVLNGKFKAILKTFGFNVTGGYIWHKSPEKNWSDLKNKWDVIRSMKQELPIDDDYIYDEMGIPKPDNYDELRQKLDESVLNAMQKADDKDEDKKSKVTNALQRLADFF